MEYLQPIDETKSIKKINIIAQTYRSLNISYLHQLVMWLRKNSLFSLLVIIPWIIAAVYLVFIKTPEYETTASIILKQNDNLAPANQLSSLFNKNIKLTAKPKETTIYLLQEYIHSLNLLLHLQKVTNIKNDYESSSTDALSRLKKNASQQEFLDYYHKKVTSTINTLTNELTITVRSFSPEEPPIQLQIMMQKTAALFHRIEQEGLAQHTQLIKERLNLSRKKLIAAEWELHQLKENRESIPSKTWEEKKLLLKFAQTEFDLTQQVYVLWKMSAFKNSLIELNIPVAPDSQTNPNIVYKLSSLLAVLIVLFMLLKMISIIIREHSD